MTASSSRESKDKLPDYYEEQAAFHKAFRAELYRLVDHLPVPPNGCVLDVPCGDGFYALRLAERVGSSGKLVAVDASDAYLKVARTALSMRDANVEFRKANIYQLPFGDGAFDLVWCAQSLISLDDPAAAVREMARVTRSGGALAVLEADEFHHLLLPWPVELEVAIHRAVLEASQATYGDRAKLAPARRVRRMLLDAGLRPRKTTIAADRQAPPSQAEITFLRKYLRSLEEFIGPYLQAQELSLFQRVTAENGLLGDEELELTCLNVVHVGRKPDSA